MSVLTGRFPGEADPGCDQASWRVIYDGTCGFCRAGQHWLARRAWRLSVVFVDGQTRGLKPEEFRQLRVLAPDGREFRGFLALVQLAQANSRLPKVWRALEYPPLRWLGEGIYRLVARHRQKISCWVDESL